jgi:predicted lipoprotein with Yx(FWY)xxD motif
MTFRPRSTPTLGDPGSSTSATNRARHRVRAVGSATVAATLIAIVFSVPMAGASGTATVEGATNATFGTILTNAQGFTLYTLPSDHDGISSCTGSCASVWPALTIPSGTTPTEGPGVTGTVSAVLQPDGADQVTYNGSPLYTFVGDSSPGQATGNGVGGFKVAQVSSAVGGCGGTATVCITSSASSTATVGSSFSFTVTTIGTPAATIKEKGKLPKGVKFHKGTGTALLSGTPTSTTHRSATGTYDVTITATFGKGKAKRVVVQSFILTVDCSQAGCY